MNNNKKRPQFQIIASSSHQKMLKRSLSKGAKETTKKVLTFTGVSREPFSHWSMDNEMSYLSYALFVSDKVEALQIRKQHLSMIERLLSVVKNINSTP